MRTWLAARWQTALIGLLFLGALAGLLINTSAAVRLSLGELSRREQTRAAAADLASAAGPLVGRLTLSGPGERMPEPDHRRLAALAARVLANYEDMEGGFYLKPAMVRKPVSRWTSTGWRARRSPWSPLRPRGNRSPWSPTWANRSPSSGGRPRRCGRCCSTSPPTPFLGKFLKEHRWSETDIGVAIAVAVANAPFMPFVGAYITHLKGSNVQVAAVVLVAQAVMIPVALLTGWLCDRWGRKPAFAIGFLALPIRIFLYSLTRDPWGLVALQALDGIGAGVYGVAVVAVCADLTRGRGGFNALQGMLATALAVGGVLGPLAAGWLADHLGYNGFFYTFAAVAAAGAALFVLGMPETRPGESAPIAGTPREVALG
jgi:hypothetical protein